MTIVEQTPATVPEVLDRAADLIGARGWAQGADAAYLAELDNDEPVCVGLAIQFAAGLSRFASRWAQPEEYARSKAATDFLRGRLDAVGVADWNDVEGRTKDEVVTALREAAAAARAEADEAFAWQHRECGPDCVITGDDCAAARAEQ